VSQNSPDQQSTQPAAPNSTHAETQSSLSIALDPQVHTQDLLDLSWAFLVISSITGFCLCVALISTLFFTSSNLPMLDFFLFISSIMTGLFSYLNYMNFWSILAIQAIWA
uniref:Uncharacterized protein n=1 Tax=Marmota marmota marmota TaxID=9994 RepID=A0A8C6EQJ9_MARMA